MSAFHESVEARLASGLFAASGFVDTDASQVFPPELDRRYPELVRGEGVWLEDSAGRRYLDAMSGGSMAATLGYSRGDISDVAHDQATRLAFIHNERLTSAAQEDLADKLVQVAPDGFTRVHFVTGGAEANEAAIRLARTYHIDRGEPERWQVISPAQAYHGPTMETLALTGRPALWGHYAPYLPKHLHIPPSTNHFDPTGEEAIEALDASLTQAGPETISVFFCEPISAAALPAYSPPAEFWRGLDERRKRHGFLIAFDEVVTAMGRVGQWFAANDLPLKPDLITTAKGLGAGYAAVGAVLCHKHVYEAIAHGSRRFSLGHTWNGAPLSCAVGGKVIDVLRDERLVERARDRGPSLRAELRDALADIEIVGEIRGHGFLLGIDFVDPGDGQSFLPHELNVAARVEEAALRNRLVLYSSQPTVDGYAGDQTLFAPALVATDEELTEMIGRVVTAVRDVAAKLKNELAARPAPLGAGEMT